MKTKIFSFIVLAIVLIGGYIVIGNKKVVVNTDPKNATYTIDGEKVTLVDGTAEQEVAPGSASKNIIKYFGNKAVGDLDGDGKDDTAFLLSEETGGTGIFYYVAVFLGKNTGTNAIFIGDRIAPQTTEIRDGKVIVNYADRARGEPMVTEPSVGVSKYFMVDGITLKEMGM